MSNKRVHLGPEEQVLVARALDRELLDLAQGVNVAANREEFTPELVSQALDRWHLAKNLRDRIAPEEST